MSQDDRNGDRLVDEIPDDAGPAVLGREPVFLSEQRKMAARRFQMRKEEARRKIEDL